LQIPKLRSLGRYHLRLRHHLPSLLLHFVRGASSS
jgi:hypothetical protein